VPFVPDLPRTHLVAYALAGLAIVLAGARWIHSEASAHEVAHGVGGTVGALLTGVFANEALNGVGSGLLYGNPMQLVIQGAAVLAAIVYSGLASFVLLKAISLVLPLRATTEDETTGLDISLHGEEAYLHSDGSGRASFGSGEAPLRRPLESLAPAHK
jgi:ammonia channel protein AmtB